MNNGKNFSMIALSATKQSKHAKRIKAKMMKKIVAQKEADLSAKAIACGPQKVK